MSNNRGFLLAESLVVSTFVLTVLIFLFVQFQNLMTSFKNSYNYNNVESIYDLGAMESYLLNAQDENNTLKNQLNGKMYLIIYEEENENGMCNDNLSLKAENRSFCEKIADATRLKKLIYTDSDIDIIKDYLNKNEDSNIDESMKDFINKIKTVKIDGKGRLIGEFNDGTFATIAIDNTKKEV